MVGRRAAKVDDNQQAVVDALRAAGCKVLSLAALAKGAPDLLVYSERWSTAIEPALIGKMHLLEVKNLSGRGNKLTPDQVKFHAEWPVTVVTSVDEALAAVGLA